jgi:hypothetical protein
MRNKTRILPNHQTANTLNAEETKKRGNYLHVIYFLPITSTYRRLDRTLLKKERIVQSTWRQLFLPIQTHYKHVEEFQK